MKPLLPALILSLCGLVAMPLQAQQSQSITHTITSEVFDSERTVHVYLPERYFRDSTQNFIAVYVLDAQSNELWEMAKSNIGYLVLQYQVIPMIAVGIVSENRGSEFSPKSTDLIEHLNKEVFPIIDNNYRLNDFKAVVGHSWGGAFVGNALFSEHKHMFDAYIGISPSLDAHDYIIIEQAAEMLGSNTPIGKYFYCATGDVGIREYENNIAVAKMDSLAKNHDDPTLAWKWEQLKHKDHWSCVIPALNNGLVDMSRNYFPDQHTMETFAKNEGESLRVQINAFYEEKTKRFGFTHKPSYKYLAFVANDFRRLEMYEAAQELYLMSFEYGNDKATDYFELAQSYEATSNDNLAKKAYADALDKLEAQKANYSERFYKNLSSAIKEKLQP